MLWNPQRTSSLTWKFRNQRMKFSRLRWETDKQIREVWGVCFLSKPAFLLFAFMDMFFFVHISAQTSTSLGLANMSIHKQFVSKNVLDCCCIFVDRSAHLLSHCTSQDMNHSTLKYFEVPYIKRNHGIPNPFVPSNLHWKCICNRRGGF